MTSPRSFYVRALLLAAAATAGAATAGTPVPQITHVIHVSVDGLHHDAVRRLLAADPRAVPAFRRLREDGVFTDNARTDPYLGNTLPNHSDQLTGRAVLGPTGHRWFINSDPEGDPPITLHTLKGSYVTSVFDVAHDHGLRTAMYASKSKFAVFDRSWDEAHGAADGTGADDGQDKIDVYVASGDMEALTSAFVAAMAVERFGYGFVHLREPDSTGHDSGWDLSTEPRSPYLAAVVRVDRQLAKILALLDADPGLAATTALIVTADHGGEPGTRTHFISRALGAIDSGIVPFYVYGPQAGIAAGDLYARNWSRFDPDERLPVTLAFLAPVRNGDAANLALDLLGLPPIPGSTINFRQNLRVLR